MNEAYGEIWLGDLLTALAETTHGDTEACIAWGAELLGLSEGLFRQSIGKEGAESGDRTDTRAPHDEAERRDERAHPKKERTSSPVAEDEPIPYTVVSQELPREGQMTAWWEEAEPLPELTEAQIELRPPLDPLFNPKTSRALISTALATQRNEGGIDFTSLFERICALRPVTRLPRLPVATLRFGIQLLIDRGRGTWPFYGDQESIRGEIQGIVGRDRVETLYFADSPLRGFGPGGRSRWRRPYSPPAAGTPVVVLTDLGIGRRRNPGMGAGEEEWLRFAERVQSAECPLLAMVPYGEQRWPLALRKAFYILSWDRATHVSLVRRTVGHGLEVRSSS